MVRQHIRAAGLTPDGLESAIAAALVDEHMMVDPIVSVTVIEHHSSQSPFSALSEIRHRFRLPVR